jgi:hypothetical protein
LLLAVAAVDMILAAAAAVAVFFIMPAFLFNQV